jgi:hypothetical protein
MRMQAIPLGSLYSSSYSFSGLYSSRSKQREEVKMKRILTMLILIATLPALAISMPAALTLEAPAKNNLLHVDDAAFIDIGRVLEKNHQYFNHQFFNTDRDHITIVRDVWQLSGYTVKDKYIISPSIPYENSGDATVFFLARIQRNTKEKLSSTDIDPISLRPKAKLVAISFNLWLYLEVRDSFPELQVEKGDGVKKLKK